MKYKKLKPSEYPPSLISNDKVCYFCKKANVELHHIFGGSNRNKSSFYGCYVFLCKEHHTGTNGVHNNYDLSKRLRIICQEQFEKKYPNKNFLQIFGKNYYES